MCTFIELVVDVEGSGKGGAWFPVAQAVVSLDHPTHALLEQSINIDVVNQNLGPASRVALELSTRSARVLAEAILKVVERAEAEESGAQAEMQESV